MNYPEKGKKVKWTNEDGKKFDESRSAEEDVQDKMVKIYEIFIKDSTIEDYIFETEDGKKEKRKRKKYKNGRFLVFSEDQVLDDKEYPYRHGKAPWVMFYDYWNPFELFGMGEADQIETLNLEFNLGLKKFANYVRRWTGVHLVLDPANGMDPEKVKEQIASGEDNVWEKNAGSEVPKVIDWGQINPAVLEFVQALPSLIEEITGVTDVSKGMVTKKQRQSASEIATLIESSYTRTRQKVRNSEWSIKRALYLVLDLMQQFYMIPRPYKIERDGQMIFNSVGSSKESVGAMMTPQKKPEPGGVESVESNQEYEEEVKDFEEFIREFGDTDQVYADFDLQVQTNSTLPMDRQSLANLMLRLFEWKAVDAKALLETLRVPKSKEIVERLQKMQYAEQGGGQPPAPGGGMEQPPPNPLQPGGM